MQFAARVLASRGRSPKWRELDVEAVTEERGSDYCTAADHLHRPRVRHRRTRRARWVRIQVYGKYEICTVVVE